MDNQTHKPEPNEPAVVKYHAPDDIGFDVYRLVAVTADLLKHSRDNPILLARESAMISDAHQQLGRMLSRLTRKEVA